MFERTANATPSPITTFASILRLECLAPLAVPEVADALADAFGTGTALVKGIMYPARGVAPLKAGAKRSERIVRKVVGSECVSIPREEPCWQIRSGLTL